MKQSGRISLLALGSLVCVVLVAILLVFSNETPGDAGAHFMEALSNHDVDGLTKLTMMAGASEEDIRKQWDFCLNHAEKYYVFAYKIEGGNQASPTSASVKVRMIKDADKLGSYDELMELPMVKVDGKWKVDVRGLSRDFFNCLPR